MARSSNRLGYQTFNLKKGVRFPYGLFVIYFCGGMGIHTALYPKDAKNGEMRSYLGDALVCNMQVQVLSKIYYFLLWSSNGRTTVSQTANRGSTPLQSIYFTNTESL